MPPLLAGDAACDAVRSLAQRETLVAAVAYPDPGPSSHSLPFSPAPPPLQILAVAAADEAVLVDVVRTPQLRGAWQPGQPVAAYDGQRLQHALWQASAGGPSRWASAVLCEQLLAGEVLPRAACTLGVLAERHQVGVPPSADAGFTALAEQAQLVLRLVRAQGAALHRAGMGQVSHLEAACVAPVAGLEAAGMPFDGVAFRNQVKSEERLLASNPEPGKPDLQAELRQLWQRYGRTFAECVAQDGRVRAQFSQIGASTGRMACNSPNLQGVPKKFGRRAWFRAPAGRTLVSGDYAACELRILAQMSGDAAYARAFAEQADVHAQVAERLFGRAHSSERALAHREAAKALGFGLIYGMQAQGLARRLGRPVAEAQQLMDQFFAAYPSIDAFLRDASDAALRRGHVTTLAGRRLGLDASDRERAKRLARNMPIQGSGADLIKDALARLASALGPTDLGVLVHCIHDSLIVECQQGRADEVGRCVRGAMEAASRRFLPQIPAAIDLHVDAAWH